MTVENIAWYVFIFAIASLSVSGDSSLVLEEGRKQYEMMRERAPLYGECWSEAVDKLHTSCKTLTEDVQSHLALAFADCFLKKAGRPGCPCPKQDDLTDCLRAVDGEAFRTYTEFFTHTQSICFYLQSQLWQRRSDETVHRLSQSSEKVSHQLQKSGNIQAEIMKLQQKSVDSQQLILQNGADINRELERSRAGVREAFEEFRASTGEQRLLINEAFQRVVNLQALVLGEFSGMYSYLFYALAMLVVYLMTSTQRTRSARFWLMGVWLANVVAERTLVPLFVTDDDSSRGFGVLDSSSTVYHRVWLCRKVSCALASALLAWFALSYKDYNLLNNQLLTNIQRQNEDLKLMIAGQGARTVQTNGYLATLYTSPHGSSATLQSKMMHYDSDDSTYDSTFVCSSSSEEGEVEDESFSSLKESSRPTTPIMQQPNDAQTFFSPRKTKQQEQLAMEMSRYNLRSRVRNSPNPVAPKEPPTAFGNIVKKMASITRRNAGKVQKALHDQSRYSSDDK